MRVVRGGAVQFGERNAKIQTEGVSVDWLNIHRSTLASEQFLGCDPVQRATWLCLLAYCADQENGGRIEGAESWVDRKWQHVVRVTHAEVHDTCPLWSWEDGCVVVWAYPVEKEAEVKRNRENGKAGGRPPKPRNNQVVSSWLTQTEPSAPISAETERKGKEEERKEEEHPLTPKGDDSHDSAEIVEAWNQGTKGRGLPSARNTDKRAMVIRTRMKESGWVEDFHAAVAYIAKSPFHRGDSASKWVADIDYLLQAGKATQLAEKAKAETIPASGGKAVVKWGGFDQVDYDQANTECRKDEHGNFYL